MLPPGVVGGMVATMASRKQRARVVAEAMFLEEGRPVPASRLDWVSDDFVDFLEQAGPRAELIVGGALVVATWLAPLSIGKRPPLSRLAVEERCRALEALEKTPAGLPLLALKAVLCLLYYEDERARAEIGIDAGCAGAER